MKRGPYIWHWRAVRGGPEEIASILLPALRRRGGNLRAVAVELAVSRRHLYRLISYANLWSVVDDLRLKARQPSGLLGRTIKRLER